MQIPVSPKHRGEGMGFSVAPEEGKRQGIGTVGGDLWIEQQTDREEAVWKLGGKLGDSLNG